MGEEKDGEGEGCKCRMLFIKPSCVKIYVTNVSTNALKSLCRGFAHVQVAQRVKLDAIHAQIIGGSWSHSLKSLLSIC